MVNNKQSILISGSDVIFRLTIGRRLFHFANRKLVIPAEVFFSKLPDCVLFKLDVCAAKVLFYFGKGEYPI